MAEDGGSGGSPGVSSLPSSSQKVESSSVGGSKSPKKFLQGSHGTSAAGARVSPNMIWSDLFEKRREAAPDANLGFTPPGSIDGNRVADIEFEDVS